MKSKDTYACTYVQKEKLWKQWSLLAVTVGQPMWINMSRAVIILRHFHRGNLVKRYCHFYYPTLWAWLNFCLKIKIWESFLKLTWCIVYIFQGTCLIFYVYNNYFFVTLKQTPLPHYVMFSFMKFVTVYPFSGVNQINMWCKNPDFFFTLYSYEGQIFWPTRPQAV